MKVIVVGSGGREHAIAWKLSESNQVEKVVCVPGNGGTALEKKCVNVNPDSCTYLDGEKGADAFVKIAKKEGCTLAVIGPEDPLAEGVADAFWAAGIPTVGPKKQGAQLEASKDLSKVFMKKHGVACAMSETFTDKNEALSYIEKRGAPIVVKADGLAAGKGVVVAKTVEEAKKAVEELMEEGKVGEAGKKLVIEDYLRGVEISVLAAVSVTKESAASGKACIIPFIPARDHKRLNDGAQGPNTGGMGAIAPVPDVTAEQMDAFNKTILEPTLKGMIEEGFDYRGFIFFGLMLTENGPKCLEYNVRLGDPETQAVLPMMESDFASLCTSITDGTLKDFALSWKKGYCVAPVAVSGGYPASYKKGMQITLDYKAVRSFGAKVFVAGAIINRRSNSRTQASDSLPLVEDDSPEMHMLITNGGRVLACSAYSDSFDDARARAYGALTKISFKGMYYRHDIGLPGAAESN